MLRLRSTVLVTVEGTALGENLLVTPRCRARVSPEPFLQELRRRPHDLVESVDEFHGRNSRVR